jgi:hypothetical protein
MAHFYGEIQGSRGATTRCGTKNSGMDCHVRGWDIGARLKVTHKDGQDYIEVFVTSGSKAKTPDKLAGTIVNGTKYYGESKQTPISLPPLYKFPQFILSKELNEKYIK